MLNRGGPARTTGNNNNIKVVEHMDNSKGDFGIQVDFNIAGSS
jgi:hypothetical protein